MGLFTSLKSIAKNLGSALSTTAATAGRKAVERARTAYEVTKSKPQVTVHKSTPKSSMTAVTTPSPKQVASVSNSTTHKKHRPASAKVAEKAINTAQKAADSNKELERLKAENEQLRDWINKKKEAEQAEKDRVYRNKYEQYGIDDESRLNLNSAGLTVDANSGKIVSSNGKLIMENLGYTPDEISRFFRENPQAADIEESSVLRQLLDAFFNGSAWDGADYVTSSGSF